MIQPQLSCPHTFAGTSSTGAAICRSGRPGISVRQRRSCSIASASPQEGGPITADLVTTRPCLPDSWEFAEHGAMLTLTVCNGAVSAYCSLPPCLAASCADAAHVAATLACASARALSPPVVSLAHARQADDFATVSDTSRRRPAQTCKRTNW